MSDDDNLLPPTPAPTPVADPPTGHRELRCQFCKSSLTQRGEVIQLSEKAKQLRDWQEKAEDAERDLADAQATITRLQGEIEEAKRLLEPKKEKITWNW